MPQSAEMQKLEVERNEIENRINLRAAIHHSKDVYYDYAGTGHMIDEAAMRALHLGPSAVQDGERYVEIQNRQWELCGLVTKRDRFVPPS